MNALRQGVGEIKANSIHLGRDGNGFYFSVVEENTGRYQSVGLRPAHIILLMKQAAQLIIDEMIVDAK